MKTYLITKYFRGGSTQYFALMPKNKRMKKSYWQYQLEDWGESTAGGYNYGYKIKAARTTKTPNGKRMLKFNKGYLK